MAEIDTPERVELTLFDCVCSEVWLLGAGLLYSNLQ